jgi:hypothetical protein
MGVGWDAPELVAREEDRLAGEQVGAGEEVLRGGDDDLAVARRDEIREHTEERERLGARLLGLRQVQIHLVAVEVGIVRRAHALVKAEGAARHHARTVRHNRELVQRRLTVEEHHVAVR